MRGTSGTARGLVAALAVSAALLGACADAPTPSPATSPSAALAAPAAPASPAAPARPATSTSTSGEPQPGTPGGPCSLANLRGTVTPPAGDGEQRTVRIVWTNTGREECTMEGFGEVILQSAPGTDWELGGQFALRQQERSAPSTRLGPGGQAHTTITYLVGTGDTMADPYTPTEVIALPPGAERAGAVVLRWTGGPVSYQAGATRPGSFFGPVEPGA